MHNASLLDVTANDAVRLNNTRTRNVDNLPVKSEQRKERELFSWHSPFPLGGESERVFFAFFKPGHRKHTKVCVNNYVTNAHFLSVNVILPIPRPRAGGRRQNL